MKWINAPIPQWTRMNPPGLQFVHGSVRVPELEELLGYMGVQRVGHHVRLLHFTKLNKQHWFVQTIFFYIKTESSVLFSYLSSEGNWKIV